MIEDLVNFTHPKDFTEYYYFKVKNRLKFNQIKLRNFSNKKFLRKIKISQDAQIEPYTIFNNVSCLNSLGSFSYTQSNLGAGVKAGRYCSISYGISIMGAHHFPEWASTSPIFYNSDYHDLENPKISPSERSERRINIGNDVWIGSNVTLKPNINIGDGAIIASHSVVTKDVPPYSVVGGIPAKIIKMRFPDPIIEKFMKFEWWKFHKNDLINTTLNEPELFLEQIEEKISNKKIEIYSPKILYIKDFEH
ncbi:CatB-related O-acetyltransferase [Acinetobacter schindleri]|uniref:CatB-related O-acetyltransferase n=1 Tax=Acinetobacter schindleri TaxID=108981 RepID=UPI000972CEBD|nr:CatB-related O-acetyltransferase [Acinetobacter schindleri]APX61844.1 O-acetyltransferase LpxA-like protein [Acinetobacter schindleri]MCO8067221.1 CatB-related O-acetyltransferase [Acinetobacter schindleri]